MLETIAGLTPAWAGKPPHAELIFERQMDPRWILRGSFAQPL